MLKGRGPRGPEGQGGGIGFWGLISILSRNQTHCCLISTPKKGKQWVWPGVGPTRLRMDGGHLVLLVQEGFILPVLPAKGRGLSLCSLSPSRLSRLQLQDRIQIIPFDVTLGTFPTHLPWGRGAGHRCCWVDEACAEVEGGLPNIHSHTLAHPLTHTTPNIHS